jgi:hypothetical protein
MSLKHNGSSYFQASLASGTEVKKKITATKQRKNKEQKEKKI